MFFRRRRAKNPTFEERLDMLRRCGFTVEPQANSRTRVNRNDIAAILEPVSDAPAVVEKAGLVQGGEIGALIDGGYQKFWRTPSGRMVPALAEQLKSLHEFEEDLRQGLGLESLYNVSLGTTFNYHLYDRVEGRDRAVRPARPWQRATGNAGQTRP